MVVQRDLSELERFERKELNILFRWIFSSWVTCRDNLLKDWRSEGWRVRCHSTLAWRFCRIRDWIWCGRGSGAWCFFREVGEQEDQTESWIAWVKEWTALSSSSGVLREIFRSMDFSSFALKAFQSTGPFTRLGGRGVGI